MKDVLVIVIGFFIVCAFIGKANGQTDFNNDAVITQGEYYDWIRVFNTSTVDNYGNIDHCQMYDTSILNLYDTYDGSLDAVLECYNYSTVNIHGFVFPNMSFVTAYLHDYSTFNIYDDGSAPIMFLSQDSSTINVYGGDAYLPDISNNATLNVYGGYLQLHGSGMMPPPIATATINIYGWDFVYEPQTGQFGSVSKLTGVGVYGPIEIDGLPDPAIYDNVNLIPEPCSMVLLSFGGLALIKRRR